MLVERLLLSIYYAQTRKEKISGGGGDCGSEEVNQS